VALNSFFLILNSLGRLVTPNRQLPFRARYHREKGCHAFALGDLRPAEAISVFDLLAQDAYR
jgi:hypothetical protein